MKKSLALITQLAVCLSFTVLMFNCINSTLKVGYFSINEMTSKVNNLPGYAEYLRKQIDTRQINTAQDYQERVNILNEKLDSLKRNKLFEDTLVVSNNLKEVWKDYDEFTNRQFNKEAVLKRTEERWIKKTERTSKMLADVAKENSIDLIYDKISGNILFLKSGLNPDEVNNMKNVQVDISETVFKAWQELINKIE